MGKHKSHIIRSQDKSTNSIVFTYEPKKFPVRHTQSSNDFLKIQREKTNDFKISELVAEQTGIAENQRQQLALKVEEQTLQKLKEIEERAYKEAFDLGMIEGTEKAFKENSQMFAERVEILDKILSQMEVVTTQVYAESESEIMRLITAIASKIAMFEVQSNPQNLVENIEVLFHELKSDQRVVLKINENDALFINTLRERTDQSVDFLKNVKIEIDENMTEGGCILESNFGAIDATIEQRVHRVWSAMQEKLPRINEDRVEIGESVEATSKGEPENIDNIVEISAADSKEVEPTAEEEGSDDDDMSLEDELNRKKAENE